MKMTVIQSITDLPLSHQSHQNEVPWLLWCVHNYTDVYLQVLQYFILSQVWTLQFWTYTFKFD